MTIRILPPCLTVVLLTALPLIVSAQEPGDRVVMRSTNAAGVPVHPADGDRRFVRWPNGSTGIVQEVGTERGWLRVTAADGDEGWIVRRYLTVIDEPDDEPGDGTEELALSVGAWNLEHFKVGASRGFPENGSGGPTYQPHERELDLIAGIIRDDLQAAILVLNEINGRSGSNPPRSDEMDSLVSELGSGWAYELSESGRSLRIAILFNTTKVRRGACHEFEIPFQEVQSADISPRDPFACAFTFLSSDGSAQNDLVVIGVHLKSLQRLNRNHNAAMAALAARFPGAFDGDPFDASERDIVIAGDFNASRYDSREEDFWDDFGGAQLDIDVLAPQNGSDYPPTRLRSVPLRPGSQIDYVMASSVSNGVGGDLVRSTAHVHHELLISPFEDFRRKASDHIPVTIRIRVGPDDD